MEAAVGYEKELKSHVERERAAVKLSSKVGELLYDKGIELVLFRNHLTDITVSEILNLHEYARNVVNKPIDVFTSSELVLCKSALSSSLIGMIAEADTAKEGDFTYFMNETTKKVCMLLEYL